MDEFLKNREKGIADGTYYDDDEDDDLKEGNTIPAPKQPPFSDSPPSHIHGAGNKKDLFG